MMVIKRNQVVIVSLLLLIIAVAAINFTIGWGNGGTKTSTSSQASQTDKLLQNGSDTSTIGASALVDDVKTGDKTGQPVFVEDTGREGVTASTQASASTPASISAETASQVDDGYFAQARCEREASREANLENLQRITNDATADETSRTNAYMAMTQLVKNSEAELQIEKVLLAKGFVDVVAFVKEDNVEIIVRDKNVLTAQQAAQALDAAVRQTGIDPDNVHIIPRS